MFGTMGITELVLILVIVMIIFGAGKLPQIGEGMGKALKGFKKEVHEIPAPVEEELTQEGGRATSTRPTNRRNPVLNRQRLPQIPPANATAAAATAPSNVPYTMGPERTPGTTAAMMYGAGPQAYQPPAPKAPTQSPAPAQSAQAASANQYAPPPSMEDRMSNPAPRAQASYPPLPPQAQAKPGVKRPSAVVNKAAVARVQEKQKAMRESAAKNSVSPQDMQGLGEGLGDMLRTVRQATSEIKGAIEPEVRNLQAEMDSAQKEIEQSIEVAKQGPAVQEDRTQSS